MFPRNPSFAVRLASIPFFVIILLVLWCSAANAAPYVVGSNPPSDARAQMARYNVPGGCVVTITIDADGTIHRKPYCEYSPALRARLATTGR